jgi:hypothetical protein
MPMLKLTSVRIEKCVPNDDGTYELLLEMNAKQLALAKTWITYHVEHGDCGDAGPLDGFCHGRRNKPAHPEDSLQIDEPHMMDDCSMVLPPEGPERIETRLKREGWR